MAVLITIDCLGQRFDACVLANEPLDKPMNETKKLEDANPTADDSNVTKIEIKSEDATKEAEEEQSERLTSDQDNNQILTTVGELRAFIADKLQIELDTAKIIHRGKLIGNNKNERLSTLRFKNKDVIKVMGLASKTDPGFAKLCSYERTNLVRLNRTFEQNGQDLDSLERNFLDGVNRAELIKKTEKVLRCFNEAAEKHLEAIDGLEINTESTSEEQKTRNREKRKQIVDGILKLLHLNDKYLHRLDDYKFRVEHPDEGR